MGLKNLPPPKTPKKTSSIDDIEMNILHKMKTLKQTFKKFKKKVQEVQEEKKTYMIS